MFEAGEMKYEDFLFKKTQYGDMSGFDAVFVPDFLFDFQKELLSFSVKKGRSAIFADCGLGKTPLLLTWAENIVRHTNKNILIVTPLAVSHQTIREGEKFGIEVKKSADGQPKGKKTVTNYERLHLFNPDDFIGVVCDESSILKNFDGTRRGIITEFLRKRPYRLLCTATASPNDYIELGTTSEALGEMGYMDMLGRFFKNEQSNCALKTQYRGRGDRAPHWRFKKHAEIPFWKWICSWSRAIRKPSDMGFDDGDFILPELIEKQHLIEDTPLLPGELFARPAVGLKEQREEMRLTIEQRCNLAAELTKESPHAVLWCHLNDEGNYLEKIIPDAVQVSGSDSDEKKEDILKNFSEGNIRFLITKPKIAGFGLNWQHCSHMTFFPSHSFEQYYQSVRRCWRFGQKNKVKVDIITTHGGDQILRNMTKKAAAADKMFAELIRYMNDYSKISTGNNFNKKVEVPLWL